MSFLSVFRAARKARIADTSKPPTPQQVAPAGSRLPAVLAYTAAALLIIAAGSQNVSYAWDLGLHHGEFRAAVLAMASIGATLLGPFAFVAAVRAVGKRHFGTALIASMLGLACLIYAAVCSLGFVSGSRDLGTAQRADVADARADAADRFKAAKAELATLTGQAPRIVERRRELSKIMADTSLEKRTAGPARTADSQASALAFYLSAAGWRVDAATVGMWLSLATVLFLEAAAAFSLMVATALGRAPVRTLDTPAHPQSKPADATPEPRQPSADWNPPLSRKLTTKVDAQAAIVHTLKKRGGRVSDASVRKLGKMAGATKSTTFNALAALIAAGTVIRVGGDLLLTS